MTRTLFRLLRYSSVMIIALIIALAVSIFGTVLTYNRLSAEKPVAYLRFEAIAPQQYRALVRREDDGAERDFYIFGDEWRIDAEFLKLKPWANILGFDARYRLDRLEGRYSTINDENSRPHVAYDLAEGQSDLVANWLVPWNFLLDAQYGSSTYQDISTSDLYTVYRSQFGLLVRSTALDGDQKPANKGAIGTIFDWLFKS